MVLPLGSQQPCLSQGRDLHQAIEICLQLVVLGTLLEHEACLEGEISARPLTCMRSGMSNKVPTFPSCKNHEGLSALSETFLGKIVETPQLSRVTICSMCLTLPMDSEISAVYLPNSNLNMETVGKRPMSHEPSLGHIAHSMAEPGPVRR